MVVHRRIAQGIVALTATALLAACAPAQPAQPTAAPAKPAAPAAQPPAAPAPKPTSAPVAAPAAKPTAAPAAKPAAEAKPAAAAKPAEAAQPAAVAKPAAQPAAAAKPAFDEKAVADFYQGKTIKLIVGSSAGGGYDNYSRLIARHLGRHIPGTPNIIVENMPGASHLVAANHLFNAAPKDGTVIGNIGSSVIIRQAFKVDGVNLDAAKFRILGAPTSDHHLLIATKGTGVTRFEDLLGPNAKEVIMGGQAAGSSTDNPPALARDVVGAKIKIVSGYAGTAQIRLAVENGEVGGFAGSWESVKVTDKEKLDSGEWLVLAQYTDEPLPELAKVPSILTFARTDEQRQLLRFGNIVPNQFARPYLLPPGVPEERAAALEAAFAKTMVDKEFLADAEKSKLDISPLSGPQIQKLIGEFLAMPDPVREKLKPILLSE